MTPRSASAAAGGFDGDDEEHQQAKKNRTPDPCLCGVVANPLQPSSFSSSSSSSSSSVFTCHLCHTHYHRTCVQNWFHGQKAFKLQNALEANSKRMFVCPRCRLKHLDSFQLTTKSVGDIKYFERKSNAGGLSQDIYFDLPESLARDFATLAQRGVSSSAGGCAGATSATSGTAAGGGGNYARRGPPAPGPGADIKQQGHQLHSIMLRCVRCDDHDFTGPAWPYSVQMFVNGLEKKGNGKPPDGTVISVLPGGGGGLNKTVNPLTGGGPPAASSTGPIIPPPQLGHCRKETPGIDLTHLLNLKLTAQNGGPPKAGSSVTTTNQGAAAATTTVYQKLKLEQLQLQQTREAKGPRNTLRISVKFHSGEEQFEDGEPGRCYCMGVFICKEMTIPDIRTRTLERMRSQSKSMGTTGSASRIVKLFGKLNAGMKQEGAAAGGGPAWCTKKSSDICQIVTDSVDFRSINLSCPISGDVQTVPCVSRFCEFEHLQTFDLDNFLQIQHQIRNHGQRWRCPICQRRCRPFDFRFCRFTKQVLLDAWQQTENKLWEDALLGAMEENGEAQAEADLEGTTTTGTAAGAAAASGSAANPFQKITTQREQLMAQIQTLEAQKRVCEQSAGAAGPPGGSRQDKDAKVREKAQQIAKKKQEVVDIKYSKEDKAMLLLENFGMVVVEHDGSYHFNYGEEKQKEKERRHGGEIVLEDGDGSMEVNANANGGPAGGFGEPREQDAVTDLPPAAKRRRMMMNGLTSCGSGGASSVSSSTTGAAAAPQHRRPPATLVPSSSTFGGGGMASLVASRSKTTTPVVSGSASGRPPAADALEQVSVMSRAASAAGPPSSRAAPRVEVIDLDSD
eukprot:CAMPEP_0179002164 /NCGR_PEP_ID=MMETSP0795-20121207/11822_1 /TAXON_ID=88552 /ORGANISM="Amoebophrya sp., Strain Ameob2" /LENGTH=848 /DNA_ID=CAMNT_0020695735 /DNA_START=428 /DNA_END=2974 /DNA_ORIENTATION=+